MCSKKGVAPKNTKNSAPRQLAERVAMVVFKTEQLAIGSEAHWFYFW